MAILAGSTSTQRWQGYISVSIKMLRSDTSTDFDLYLPMRGVNDPVLFHKAQTPITDELRKSFVEREDRVLLIREESLGNYKRYVENNLSTILKDTALPVRERANILYDTAQQTMKDLLENLDAEEIKKRGANLVANMIDFQQREPWSFRCLLHVASFNYYVYTHSLNVFTFATALAMRMGFEEDGLQQISMGALLHDLGKGEIDQTILNFPGKLNQSQWMEIKKHPTFGYERLARENGVSRTVLDIVRHHHEKLDGSGYPDGLSGEDITTGARISAVADIFDALTTKRVYKDALKSFPALKVMQEEMIDQIDRDIFALFVRIMGDQTTTKPAVPTRKRLYIPAS